MRAPESAYADIMAVRETISGGDLDELAELLVRIGTREGNTWHGDRACLPERVRELPEEQRRRLAQLWTSRYQRATDPEGERSVLLTLLRVADPSSGLLSAERLQRIDELSRRVMCHDHEELLALVEGEVAAGRALPGPFIAMIRRSRLAAYWSGPVLDQMLHLFEEPVLNPGEAWADQALADAETFGEPGRRLLGQLRAAVSSRPTRAWERAVLALVDQIGPATVRHTALSWLDLAGKPRTLPLDPVSEWENPRADSQYDPYNVDALRGLAWLTALLTPGQDIVRGLGGLAETSLRKVPGIGPRNPKVANAAVTALARIEGEGALAELARLATRVTYKATLKMIGTALDVRAEAAGLSRAEIEELSVPSYGLSAVGRGEHPVGDATALLEVQGTKALLSWRTGAGRAVKTAPAAVRNAFPDAIKEVRAAAKDIDRMLTAQSERLDRQFLARRSWALGPWRECILDHPLLGTLARRLIWTVDGTPAAFEGRDLRTVDGRPVSSDPAAPITLWHPLGHADAQVAGWREWLEIREITQPFKQAHRETYPLTDAERTTGDYSNRFAGHFLRQHQFHSLAATRGWTSKLRLCVDDTCPPAYKELPQWGLRAEFWIESVGGREEDDLTESGAYTRISTDQVRFYPLAAAHNWAHAGGGRYSQGANWRRDGRPLLDPLPLSSVPELVLSEVLRDVDLFVGVASVGNDPTWQDGGPRGRFRDYWHSYGFGELSTSAKLRAELLTRLIPRLAIGDRCTVEGRFLRVRGEMNAYRIHLGSGNVLIAPQDRYLCIVPTGRGSGTEAGYLPFEGDGVLSVILSKAMLLAKDREITDPTITSQL
ncbi:DUF4132 domain-containing protein [Streptomyces albipurpureus]|uniref:DUF4132 domain-containing protein n=1 Tax=Streptomyces albipurpureus TaxID=2897419 RepID=A0ABT0ULY2_9ACTN|nr:DUF4132 domain-containing protein [Streptomyces sp. CWNU-1]MCM2389341.1 DUF4132 domain-containing protein [Streptomyces sp. CWNU-1]